MVTSSRMCMLGQANMKVHLLQNGQEFGSICNNIQQGCIRRSYLPSTQTLPSISGHYVSDLANYNTLIIRAQKQVWPTLCKWKRKCEQESRAYVSSLQCSRHLRNGTCRCLARLDAHAWTPSSTFPPAMQGECST